MSTETLVPDEMAGDLLRENQISFLQLNSAEVAAQLMLRDFQLFRDIEPTEYMDDLFELNSKFGMAHLQKFSEVGSCHHLEISFIFLFIITIFELVCNKAWF